MDTHSEPAAPPMRDTTRDRLMDAAERLFAKQGFDGTSIRQITEAAGCNVASINYHFANKDGLYTAMFRRMLAQLREHRLASIRAVVDSAVARGEIALLVRAFAESFIHPLAEPQKGQRYLQLFMSEMAQPHLPPRVFLEDMVEPIRRVTVDVMRRVCPGLDDEQAGRCMHSLVGQLVHLVQIWSMFKRAGVQDNDVMDLDRAMEHVIHFTVAGIKACERGLRS